MTDRLAEIKVRRIDATNGSWTTDLDWLIAEVERLKEALDLAVNEQITYFDGMEQAAVIVENPVIYYEELDVLATQQQMQKRIAAAIRAKIKT